MNNYLSNIELYYSPPVNIKEEIIRIDGEEYNHVTRVMRHNEGEKIYVTDGKGNIYEGNILNIKKEQVEIKISNKFSYENNFSNIFFCITRLKNSDRFEFALEKCAELGITNYIVFESERTVAKGEKITRWNKILLSAMKQSLRSYLPEVKEYISLNNINDKEGKKFIFEQNAESFFDSNILDKSRVNYLLFGPEGGFSEKELNLFPDAEIFKLGENRLRSETAIIKCASTLK